MAIILHLYEVRGNDLIQFNQALFTNQLAAQLLEFLPATVNVDSILVYNLSDDLTPFADFNGIALPKASESIEASVSSSWVRVVTLPSSNGLWEGVFGLDATFIKLETFKSYVIDGTDLVVEGVDRVYEVV